MSEIALEFSQLVDALPGLVWTALPDGRAEYVNRRWRDYTGLGLEDAVGHGWRSAIHPDDRAFVLQRWAALLASGRPGEMEARLRRRDGTYRSFQFGAAPSTDEVGRIVRWCALQTDIDDMKSAEAMLAAEKRLLELVARGVPLPTVLEELCREVEQLAQGCYCSILLVDGCGTRFRVGGGPSLPSAYNTILDGKAIDPGYGPCSLAVALKAPVITADLAHDPRWAGSVWPPLMAEYGLGSCWSMPIVSSSEAVLGIFAIYRHEPEGPTPGEQELIDRFTKLAGISIERAQAEEALNRARAELAHVSRATALSALTASIAHEVNQPLSGIITNASTCLRMLAADPPDLDGARSTAQRTIRDGNRASEVIQRLRALFARQHPTLGPVDLNDAAREVLALSASELQRSRVVLATDFADALPVVSGDRVQLQQVVLNLVLNAVDAMKTVDDRPRNLSVSTGRGASGQVVLSVRDSGVGFAPQSLDRVFDAFYTTKPDGMGIGLSISRSIVEGHEGRLWAARNDGPGVAFSFAIPCAGAPLAPAARDTLAGEARC